MTHDELLELIDFLPLGGLHASFQPALRAVVELHKPDKFGEECTECLTTLSYDAYPVDYPCPTIQAIEKEL